MREYVPSRKELVWCEMADASNLQKYQPLLKCEYEVRYSNGQTLRSIRYYNIDKLTSAPTQAPRKMFKNFSNTKPIALPLCNRKVLSSIIEMIQKHHHETSLWKIDLADTALSEFKDMDRILSCAFPTACPSGVFSTQLQRRVFAKNDKLCKNM